MKKCKSQPADETCNICQNLLSLSQMQHIDLNDQCQKYIFALEQTEKKHCTGSYIPFGRVLYQSEYATILAAT
jgi:hypothetical protein